MNDFARESLSYFGMYSKMLRTKKLFVPERVSFGIDKDQHFLYYAPDPEKGAAVRSKTIFWVHGGGWNAGTPAFFDFVGQRIAGEGYPFISLGYRLSPKNKYPRQIEDVCAGYKAALAFLRGKGNGSPRIVLSGSSAGAHLSSILCYGKKVQDEYGVDISDLIGYLGIGGPYCLDGDPGWVLRTLLKQLFEPGYDRTTGDPSLLMEKNSIPMLLIQSEHDGLIDSSCVTRMAEKAASLGNKCELYPVTGRHDTHSWYTAGMFLETREENATLDKFFSWIENL